MGLFKNTPKTAREQRVYDDTKASALKEFNDERGKARMEQLKSQARMDALPRVERAKQRSVAGFLALKRGVSKLQAFDARMQARAKAQGSQSSVVAQGPRQTPPLLQQSIQRDQASPPVGLVQKSLKGPQGEGLIIAGLRASVKAPPRVRMR
jgi:hypothetical protein